MAWLSRWRGALIFMCVLCGLLGLAPRAALAQTCGAQWLPQGATPSVNGTIITIASWDPDGAGPRTPVLVVGGTFTIPGVPGANNIAVFDPATLTWSPLGTGTSGGVRALAALPNGDLVAGGLFSNASGNPASNIARWSPGTSTWSALGAGVNSVVYALATLPNGDLVAGGFFSTAGGSGNPAGRIARWSPTTSTWSTLGGGLDAEVNALAALPNGDVVAAGRFANAGGNPASRIARWNAATSTWVNLGTGLNNTANAVAVLPGGDIVAGGSFNSAGGTTVNFIARWNPGTLTWSALGAGVSNTVRSLAVLPNGDLIAGGDFISAGGSPASLIARWSPTTLTWSPLGSGMNDVVSALAALPSGEVAAVGLFTTAGDLPNPKFARYTFTNAPFVARQPVAATVTPGGTITLSAIPAAGYSNVSVRWQRNGVNISNGVGGASDGGGVVSGASGVLASPTNGEAAVLTITSARPSDAGAYTAIFTNACGSATTTSAQVTVPITVTGRDFRAKYGTPLWVQSIGTQFGDSTLGNQLNANGSEIDAAYARIANGVLYVAYSGNLESNGNSAVIAVDFFPGGPVTLQLPASSLLNLQNMNGLSFDSGFTPEVVVAYSTSFAGHTISGALNGSPTAFGTSQTRSGTAPIVVTGFGAPFQATVDNSNASGVGQLGASFVSPPGSVDTGVEFSIPLTALGWNGISRVRIAGFINGQSNDFLSNQVLGGLPPGTGNLGGDGNGLFTGSLAGINFNNFAGNQFLNVGITIPTVPVGNPGNPADPSTGNTYGSVAYSYSIGQTEVTNAQYVAFLNAVAAADTNGLYNTQMAGALGGITRAGASGSHTYATVAGRENHPVNFVSFWDACRFANWMHNGQPTGAQSASTTEDGAYTLTPGAISANTVVRNANWRWAVTNENEWYKAAYHQPASAGGDSDNYWLYPTSSNGTPTTGQANYGNSVGNTTPVGSYAANFYGTFDMAGNVWEWNEAVIIGALSLRGIRGGSVGSNPISLRADDRNVDVPSGDDSLVGFRLSQAIDAPAPVQPPNLRPTVASGPTGDVLAVDTTASVAFSYAAENIGTGAALSSAGWTDAAYLSVNTTIDAGDLRVPISRTGPVGVSTTYNTGGTFTGVPPGTYNLIVRVNDNGALDEGGQTSDNTLVAAAPVRVIEPVIDLAVSVPTVSPLPVVDLYPVTISATVAASGTDVASSCRGRLILLDAGGPGGVARQTVLTASTLNFSGTTGAGATRTLAFSGVLPVQPVAPVSVVATIDQLSTSARNDTAANNSATLSFTLAPPPDLAVESIGGETTIVQGLTAGVNFTVRNVSTSALPSSAWTDRVYVSDDSTPSADDLQQSFPQSRALSANAAYSPSATIADTAQLAPGEYFVIVVSNVGAAIAEASSANNTLVRASQLRVQSRPNLRPTGVSLPGGTDLAQGAGVTVRWTDQNEGPGAANGPWTDRVVLSANATFGDADDRAFPAISAGPASLAANADTEVEQTITIPIDPQLPPGNYSLFVQANVTGVPLEVSQTDNVSPPLAVRIVRPPAPNLVARAPSGPSEAVSGTSVQVCWGAENLGDAAANGPWTSRVYLSTDRTLDLGGPSPDVLLDEFPVRPSNIALAPGQSTSQCELVTLPPVTGIRYFIVWVSPDGSVQEYLDTADNIAAAAASIDVRPEPVPDLTVPSVGALGGSGASVFSGASVNATFRVLNDDNPARPDSATGPTSTPVWFDRVYLSPNNPVRDGSDVLLGTTENLIFLRPGESYTQNVQVALPEDLFGSTFYLIAETDATNVVSETNNTNNAGASPAFAIQLPSQPDLVATDVSTPLFNLPDPSVATGMPLQVKWTESNSTLRERSGGDTRAVAWTSRVYLSPSPDAAPPGPLDTVLGDSVRPRSSPLVAGAADPQRSATFDVPGSIAGGNYYLKVQVDSSSSVTERTLEDNNIAVSSGTLTVQRTAPNLVPTRVVPNSSALPGNLLLASYTVENRGDPMPSGGRWTDRLFLSADRTVDPADIPLTPDSPRVAGNLGTIDGSDSPGYVVTQSYRLPGTIPPGRYWLGLRVNVENTVDERSDTVDGTLDNALFSAVQVDVPAQYADLGLSTPSTALITAAPGSPVRVDWTTTNVGSAPTPVADWIDEVVLSTDASIDGGDRVLAAVGRSGLLAPGAAYSAGRVVNLPAVAAGDYFIMIKTDVGGAVLQRPTGAVPDTVAIPLRVTGDIADLVVSAVSAAPASLTGGQRVTVDWTVTNTGVRATIGNTWLDRVEVRGAGGGPVLVSSEQTRVGALAPQAGYQRQAQFDLPLGTDGAFEVVVTTDRANAIAEGDNTNNTATGVITVVAAPPANLVAGTPQAPSSGDAGHSIDVTWTVQNDSDHATSSSSWNDELWLSRDAVLGPGDTRLLGRSISGGLGPRAAYSASQTATVTIPAAASGAYRILLRTDSDGQVYERGATADNFAASAPIQVRSSNLVATDVRPTVSTVSAGRELPVTWTVRNTGAGPVPSSAWRDAIYLSRNQTLDTGDILLGAAPRSGPLAAGSPYTAEASFRVPASLSGPYFVLVNVNSDRSVPEPGGEGDNVLASSTLIDITLPDPPDLFVTDVVPPPTAQLGRPATYTWREGNAASASGVLQGTWEDSIFLSLDAVWDPGDTFVGRAPITVTSPIDPGSSFLRQASPKTPPVLPGPYFAVVRGDSRRFLSQLDTVPGNDDSSSPVAFPVTLTEITPPGQFADGAAFTTGAEMYFAVRGVTPGQTMRISFQHSSPDALAELYVANEVIPTSGLFDFAFDRPGDASQQVIIPLTDRDQYFVLARAAGPTQPPSGVVSAEYLPFQILSATPTNVGAGEVTIRVRGAQMPATTTFKLTPQGGGADVVPTRVTPAGVFDYLVTFDLTSRPGTYQLVATLGTQTDAFATPVTVSPSFSAVLSVEVGGVSTAKIGVPVEGQITVVNSGNVDVQVGELIASLPRVGTGAATLTLFPGDPARRTEISSVGPTDPPVARRLFLGRLYPQQLVTVPYSLTFNAPVPSGMGIAIGGQSRTRAEYDHVVSDVVSAAADQFRISVLASGIDSASAQAASAEFIALALSGYEAALVPSPGIEGEIGALAWASLTARPRPDSEFFSAWLPEVAARICSARFCPTSDPCDVRTQAVQAVADVLACDGCIPAIDPGNTVYGGQAVGVALDGCSGVEALSRDGSGRVLRPALPGECWPPPVASYDPNQITGPGTDGPRWISPRRRASYSITFQNDPNASSPAASVEITTPFSVGLEGGGYRGEMVVIGDQDEPVSGNAFAGVTTISDLPTESGDPVSAKVLTTVRPSPGGGIESYWQFVSIDPRIAEPPSNPFSGFLPRESPTLSGTGTVRFSVLPARLPTGTRFDTFARIVFDDNPPILTNTVFNTIDSDDPVSAIDPDGAPPRALAGNVAFMSFSASDVGSGVEGVRVLVQVDGGPYRIFQPLTTGSVAVFDDIEPGHVYGFATQAVDIASNVESLPLVPDATTVVPTLVLDPASDTGQAGDSVTSVTTPAFNVVSIPSSTLPIEIRAGGSVVVSGSVLTDARGRGTFRVATSQLLLDGTYTVSLFSDGVITTSSVTIAALAPQVQRWSSVRSHGVMGAIALTLPVGQTVTEPRAGGIHTVDIAVTSTIDPATVTPDSLQITGVDAAGSPINLSSNTVSLSAFPDQRGLRATITPSLSQPGVYCFRLGDVRSPSGASVVPGPGINVGVLPGDLSGDERTNANDFAVVRAVAAQLDGAPIDPASATQVRADFDADGDVDATDVTQVRAAPRLDLRGVIRPCGPQLPPSGGPRSGVGSNLPDLSGVVALNRGGAAPPGAPPTHPPSGPRPITPRSTEPLGRSLARVFEAFDPAPVRARGLLAVLDRSGTRDAATVAAIAAIDPAGVAAAPVPGWWIVDLGETRDDQTPRAEFEKRGFYTSPVLIVDSDVLLFVAPRVIAQADPSPREQPAGALADRRLRGVQSVGGLAVADADVTRAEDLADLIGDLLDTRLLTAVEPDLAVIAPAPAIDQAPWAKLAPDDTPIELTVLGLEAEAPSAVLAATEAELSEFGLGRARFVTRGGTPIGVFAGGERTLVFTSHWLAALSKLGEVEPGVMLDSTRVSAVSSPAIAQALRAMLGRGWLAVIATGPTSSVLATASNRQAFATTPAATTAAAAALARARLANPTADEVAGLMAPAPIVGIPASVDPIRIARAARPQADVNGDGRVTSEDVLALKLLIEASQERKADLNGDGAVDEADLLVVLKALE